MTSALCTKNTSKYYNDHRVRALSAAANKTRCAVYRAEMEEIKKEILSLSEKYSIKCVESANLEEELKSANSQLAQAQQQIIQLDSR